MFRRLFRHDRESDAIATALYGAIVAQARQPALYADFGVADTVDGRFEMVVLHLALVVQRLQSGSDREKQRAQGIFDVFSADMDLSLRELGVGDLGVPKRMKKMAERFYGRAAAYGAALADGDTGALADAIERNVFGRGAPGVRPLAEYAMETHRTLAAMPASRVLEGSIDFSSPSAFAPSGLNA